MLIKTPRFIRRLVKTTQFWQDNALVLREFKHFKKVAILALIFTLLAAAFEGFGVGFLLTFLQSLTEPNAEPIKTGIEWFDVFVLASNASAARRLYQISGLILLTTLIRVIFIYLGRVYTGISQSHLAYQLRIRLFEQLQSLSLSYFSQVKSGELINTLTAEITQIMQAFEVVSFLLIRFSTLTVYLIAMVLLSWQLTLLSVLLFSLLSVGIASLLKKVREISFVRTKARGIYTSAALEFISGIRTVQAFAAQEFERQRFYDSSDQILQAEISYSKRSALVEPLTESVATTILIGMLVIAFATLIPTGQLQIASLLTFLFILFRLMPIVRQLNGARARLSNFQGSMSNINELLRTDNKPYLLTGTRLFPGLNNTIEFKSVNFGYDSEKLVLQDINLIIEQGKTTAFVGGSGAGKSTLVDLIPRFYDPINGQILINGIKLNNFDINSLRRKIAIVSQDTFIFNTSVQNNIAYAMMETVSKSEIAEAARQANALEFIQDLPQGFDTQLGDRGVRLSGGQRQRIAIARALLRDPEILILDEATSALDSVSEQLIQESLEKLSVGRTVIAIAHRLSTIVRADKVVVLEQGKIVEEGTYQELLDRQGKLWKYHQMQHDLTQAS
ncbi:MAG: heterocyst formation ABC transporter subunit HepA [Microcoleaceae cyanobacterium]